MAGEMAQVFFESNEDLANLDSDPERSSDEEASSEDTGAIRQVPLVPIGQFGWYNNWKLCKIRVVYRVRDEDLGFGWMVETDCVGFLVGRVGAGVFFVHRRQQLTLEQLWYHQATFKLDVCARLWGLDKLVAKSKPLVWELVMDFLRGK